MVGRLSWRPRLWGRPRRLRDQQLKHPLALGTDPASPPRPRLAKAARLNSNGFRRPTAKPIDELHYGNTPRRCPAFNFRPAIALWGPHPMSPDTGKQRLVRELPKNRRRTEVSVSYSGSPGAVGRHNNTYKWNYVWRGCRGACAAFVLRTLRRLWRDLWQPRPMRRRRRKRCRKNEGPSPLPTARPSTCRMRPSRSWLTRLTGLDLPAR
jgi:hypothetical protein